MSHYGLTPFAFNRLKDNNPVTRGDLEGAEPMLFDWLYEVTKDIFRRKGLSPALMAAIQGPGWTPEDGFCPGLLYGLVEGAGGVWYAKAEEAEEVPYYDRGGVKNIDILKAKLTPAQFEGFLRGNVIKYATRMEFKGCKKADAAKLAEYAKWLQEAVDENDTSD